MDFSFNAILSGPCGYCYGYHTGLCPKVRAIEYHPDGTTKRVEFWPEGVEAAPHPALVEATTWSLIGPLSPSRS